MQTTRLLLPRECASPDRGRPLRPSHELLQVALTPARPLLSSQERKRPRERTSLPLRTRTSGTDEARRTAARRRGGSHEPWLHGLGDDRFGNDLGSQAFLGVRFRVVAQAATTNWLLRRGLAVSNAVLRRPRPVAWRRLDVSADATVRRRTLPPARLIASAFTIQVLMCSAAASCVITVDRRTGSLRSGRRDHQDPLASHIAAEVVGAGGRRAVDVRYAARGSLRRCPGR